MPRKSNTGLEHTKTVKRGKVEYVYFNTGEKIDGKVVYVPLGRKDAVEFGAKYSAAKRARTMRNGLPTSLTVPQLVIRYERSPGYRKKSYGTQRTYSVYLNRLAREFDTAPAGGLDQASLYELMDEMAAKPAAVDMLLLAGGQMYSWAMQRKYVLSNPFAGIDREEWDAAHYEPWPEDLLEEALADPSIGLPVALLYYTAQRIGDVCRMRWDDVADGTIRVEQQKTGKKLVIPIHSRLAEALANAPRSAATILVGPDGKKLKDQTLRDRLKRFGLARGVDLVPHGLRKNAVNALLEAECSTAETSAISGQSLRMVEHYARKRNSERIGKRAMQKWERAGNRETTGKTPQELAEN